MHDPMVVAHELVLPIPVRKWPSMKRDPRWGFKRIRRTNAENLGEPVYPWWRPAGYECFIAGARVGLYRLGTIWHNEPRGADSWTYCKWEGNWRWHVHHWSIQVHAWQSIRRWLFDRCAECGLRFPYGYSPVGFSWNPPRPPWWAFWRPRCDLRHDKCADLHSARRDMALDKSIILRLVAECSLRAGESEDEFLARVYKRWEFGDGYRLMGLLEREWNEEHTKIVKR